LAIQGEYEIERRPVLFSFNEEAAFTETYGFSGNQGAVFLEGQLIVPTRVRSDSVLLFMHPASALNLMPLPLALAKSGRHVLCCLSRYARNDSALIMEKVAVDLGAHIRHARETLGYKKVILAGWSGGGSLAAFYQSQAEKPDIAQTPAGDPYDLRYAGLIGADALMLIAAHTGRARTLSEWIDPSVLDERDPDQRDDAFDLYSASGPKAPYPPAFIEAYRAAQKARIERITDNVLDLLARLKKRGGKEVERGFVVHRTMADPRFLDGAIEPNGRKPNWCYLGHPETVNSGPVGLARFSTLRAWMSQWALGYSRADAVDAVSKTTAPLLVIENEADDAVPTSHPKEIFAAATVKDKTYRSVPGASHYYQGQPRELLHAISILTEWMDERNLLG